MSLLACDFVFEFIVVSLNIKSQIKCLNLLTSYLWILICSYQYIPIIFIFISLKSSVIIYTDMHKASKSAQPKEPKVKNIEVAVRMRPILVQFEDEEAWNIDCAKNVIESLSGINESFALHNLTNISSTSITMPKKSMKGYRNGPNSTGVEKNNRYEFVCDYAFGTDHQNHEIYSRCCKKIIQDFILNGKNGTIFMYGQTTSGKTYTMLGDQHTEGLITYSLKDVCKHLANQGQLKLNISYFEIYNEQINDLLHPGSVNLKIVDDKVYGAEECAFQTFQDAVELLKEGEEQRSYSEKKCHDHSSRSHTIFQIKQINQKTGLKAVLNLVDLAGSERLTDDDSNEETGYINKSLFVLSNVINRLASGKKNTHIPFRDSKLTRILAPSLTGTSSTVVICTISPASINFYQTLSTLRFASCSRKIKLKPKNSSPDSRDQSMNQVSLYENQKLQKENEQLKKMVKQLKSQSKDDTNFLYEKMSTIREQIENDPILSIKTVQNSDWRPKVEMLCREYRKNILTLQKQYTKAMINAISVECGIDREKLVWATQQFHDI